jgi:hypothetical protein
MPLGTRLQRVTQALSPLQRITLMLEALRDGREVDPELQRISDPHQAKAFRRYIALLYTSNSALGPRCDAVAIVAGDLDVAANQVRLLEQAAGVLEQDHGLKRPRRVRDWHQSDRIEVNEFLRSLAAELRNDLVEVLALRWQELRAVELLWDELTDEFGGADPVDPQFREKVVDAAARMKALAKEMNATRRLVEPGEAVVAEARRAVDDAFDRMEPLL